MSISFRPYRPFPTPAEPSVPQCGVHVGSRSPGTRNLWRHILNCVYINILCQAVDSWAIIRPEFSSSLYWNLTATATTVDSMPDPTITSFRVRDLRWPTSLENIGSDPMNVAGENALGYLEVETDAGLKGVGWSFSNGQGNEYVSSRPRRMHQMCLHGKRVLCAAIQSLSRRLVDRKLSDFTTDMAATQRKFQSGQIRFMSPERGVLQLATCAVLNCIWDLWAKTEGKPLWKLVCDLSPERFVSCIDFRYLTDVLTREQALEMLQAQQGTKASRMQLALENQAVPAYNTSVGWLGLSDDQVKERLREAAQQGFRHFKLKAGLGIETDRKRLSLVREAAGEDVVLMVDVNQLWDVDEAIEYMKQLSDFKLWFIEEPTAPDDVLGHAKIRKALKHLGMGVATGEHVNTRTLFKQLLQAEALDAVQLDACRLAGVNEILAVLLLAAKFGVPVVPHSG